MDDGPIRYVALNCTLKRSPEASSTEVLLARICSLLEDHGATGHAIRVVDRGVAFGVRADEGDGDGWPEVRAAVLDAHLLVLGTPIWMGHPASTTQMVLERLNAFLGETDDRGQMQTVDRVAVAVVVGNEDGAHHVGAEVFQGLNDVGFALPPGAMTYWVGAAMEKTDLKDLGGIPASTDAAARAMVANAVHLVRRLRDGGRFPDLA